MRINRDRVRAIVDAIVTMLIVDLIKALIHLCFG